MRSAPLKIFAVCFGILSSSQSQAFTFTSGDPLQTGWAQSPLRFYVNYTDCPDNINANIQKAFDLWNSVTSSSLKVEIGDESTQTAADVANRTVTDSPLITCDIAFSDTVGVDGDSIPGVGILGTGSQPLTSGGLILNVEPGKSANINSISETLVNVVTAHEIGHVLGLGHSTDTASLMYYDASAKGTLSLSQDDIDGITFLYPRKEISDPALIGGCGSISSNNFGPPSDWWNGNSLAFLLAVFFGIRLLSRQLRRFKLASQNSLTA